MTNKKKLSRKKHSQKDALLSKRDKIHLWFGYLSLLTIATAFALYGFLALTHASLAPVSLGSIKIDSGLSESAIKQGIQGVDNQYRLVFTYPNGKTDTYSLSDAGISIDTPASIKKVDEYLKSNLLARLVWWQPISIELAIKTDKMKLNNFVTSKTTLVDKAPRDAVLSIKNGAAQLQKEKPGNGFRLINPASAIKTAASHLRERPLAFVSSELTPDITAKKLKKSQEKLTLLLNKSVTFELSDQTIYPEASDIANWIDLTPVPKAKTVDVTVNSGKIVAYIDEIASPYISTARNKLVMKTADGEKVLDRGVDGFDVTNKDQVATEVSQALIEDADYEINAVLDIKLSEPKTITLKPYDKFIVIDTTSKKMYAYEKDKIVRTVLISAGAPNTPTVLGQYKIYSKLAKQDMRGANVDGSRYFQPNVPYVSYFHESYAIHGNYWRPKDWFGSINSSHGCVGITDPDDAWIYNWAPVGTPVIIHE